MPRPELVEKHRYPSGGSLNHKQTVVPWGRLAQAGLCWIVEIRRRPRSLS